MMTRSFDPAELRLAIADYWANMAKIAWQQQLKLIEMQLGLFAKLSQRN